jgi:hypothetical protein
MPPFDRRIFAAGRFFIPFGGPKRLSAQANVALG